LLKILVARNDNDVQAGGDCFPGQCANDVVSFISAYGDDRDVVSIEKLTNSLHPAIKVRLQLIGKLFARRFVAGVRFVAEGEPRIVHPAKIFRLVRAEQAV
jgi:hypothetical protein